MPLFSLFFPCLNVIFKSLESASALGCLQLWSFFNCSDWCGFFLSFIFLISSAIFPLRLILKTMFLWFSWLFFFFFNSRVVWPLSRWFEWLTSSIALKRTLDQQQLFVWLLEVKIARVFQCLLSFFSTALFNVFFFFLNHSVFICVLHMVCRAVFYSFQPWQRAVGTKGRFFQFLVIKIAY